MARRRWNRIRGQGGIGKTTLLKELEREILEELTEKVSRNEHSPFSIHDEIYQLVAHESLAQVDRAIASLHNGKNEIALLKLETRSLLKELMAA